MGTTAFAGAGFSNATYSGSVDYFLKIDKIEGEATDSKHAKEIDVLSWSFGESNPVQIGTGGLGAGKVSMSDFNFMTRVSKASPLLMKACALGEHIKEVTLTARKAGGGQQEYYTIKFSDVLISSYQVSASSEVPTESVSFAYSKIEVEYKPQKADGTLDSPVKFGYDLKAVKKL